MEQAAALPPQHKAEASDPTPRPSPASADENNKPCLLLHLDASKTLVRAMQPDKPFVVGRAANADAQLLVPHISASHCTMFPPQDPSSTKWRLRDTSSYGTWLNGQLVGRGKEVALSKGDIITFSAKQLPNIVFCPSRLPNGAAPISPVLKRQRISAENAVEASPSVPATASNELLRSEVSRRNLLESRLDKQRKELVSVHEQLQAMRAQLEAKDEQLLEAEAAIANAKEEGEAQLLALQERTVASARNAHEEGSEQLKHLLSARDAETARAARLEQRLASKEDESSALARRVRFLEESARVASTQQATSEGRLKDAVSALQSTKDELHEKSRQVTVESARRQEAESKAEAIAVNLHAAELAAKEQQEASDEMRSLIKDLRAEVADLRKANLEQAEALRNARIAANEASTEATAVREQLRTEVDKQRQLRESSAADKTRLQREVHTLRGELRSSGKEVGLALKRAHLAEQRVSLHVACSKTAVQQLAQIVSRAEHDAAKLRSIQHEIAQFDDSGGTASYDGMDGDPLSPQNPGEDCPMDSLHTEEGCPEGSLAEWVQPTQGLATGSVEEHSEDGNESVVRSNVDEPDQAEEELSHVNPASGRLSPVHEETRVPGGSTLHQSVVPCDETNYRQVEGRRMAEGMNSSLDCRGSSPMGCEKPVTRDAHCALSNEDVLEQRTFTGERDEGVLDARAQLHAQLAGAETQVYYKEDEEEQEASWTEQSNSRLAAQPEASDVAMPTSLPSMPRDIDTCSRRMEAGGTELPLYPYADEETEDMEN